MRKRPVRLVLRKQSEKKRNPLLYIIPLLLGVGFILLFGFYLLTLFVFPSMFGQCVAVVGINGPIMTESIPATIFSEPVPGSEEIAEQIASLEDRPDIGAVVFVINSGGGSVIASREIYEAINYLSIPKVSYFKEVAASGAYYIATPSDYIISEPYAITGSLGVIMSTMEFSELMDEFGINATVIKSGEHKDIGSELKSMDQEELEILQEMVDKVFEDFKSVILLHRGAKLNMELFEEVLDARIMLGMDAEEIGLVDGVGSKKDAINKAAELAGIEGEPRVCEIALGMGGSGLFDMVSFIKTLSLSTTGTSLEYSLE